jgi:hypothetical protein
MAIVYAADPSAPLYRIGRPADPLAFPPRAFTGGGRYDHPDGAFLTLYAAGQRRGAFTETLDAFRPAVADRATAARLGPGETGDAMPPAGVIPDAYLRKLVARLRMRPGQRWLDLRLPETHQALRSALAVDLVRFGYADRFVWGDLLGQDRRLTQTIDVWAHDQGVHGIVYASCHDPTLDCWALFDRASFTADGPPSPIERDDPDLVAAIRLFELRLP